MSEKLILRLSSQSSSSVPWLVWSQTTSEVIVSGELDQQDNLSVLSEYAIGRHVTVLVDSADVRLYRHYMPSKPTRQLLKALPFMLEDELAEDIEKLHFAIEETGYDKKLEKHWVNIAIVKRALLQHWLTLLAQVNIQVKSVLPDVLCLPNIDVTPEQEIADQALAEQKTSAISVMGYANGWLIREAHWQGMFLTDDWLPLYFQKLLQKSLSGNTKDTESSDADNLKNTNVVVNYFSPLPSELSANLIESASVDLVTAEPELPMLLLAQQAEKFKWNLLQGEFSPKKAISKNWAIWRSTAAILLITIVVKFSMTLTQWQGASHELALAKTELNDMYQAAFPKEKLRVNILRTQLKRKVAAVGGSTGEGSSGFVEFMTQLTPIFKQSDDVIVDAIRYDHKRNELRLNASAPSFQKFEQFKNDIENVGLEVKQGAVNNEGSTVSGSLSIEGGK